MSELCHFLAPPRQEALRGTFANIGGGGGTSTGTATNTLVREYYDYAPGGQLTHVHVAEGASAVRLAGRFEYDLLGRQTHQWDIRADGWVVYDKVSKYNAQGQLEVETTITRRKPTPSSDEGSFKSVVTNRFTDMYGRYTLGAVGTSYSKNYYSRMGEGAGWDDSHDLARDTETFNWYKWYDGASLEKVKYQPKASDPQRDNWSWYTHDARGALTSVRIDDGRDRTVTFTNDLGGQALRRDERDGDPYRGDPHEMWFRYGGREMGYAGNNGRTDVHYAASTAQRTSPGFRGHYT